MFKKKKIPEAPKPDRNAPILDMDWVNFNRRALRGSPRYTILEMHNMYMEFVGYEQNQEHREDRNMGE